MAYRDTYNQNGNGGNSTTQVMSSDINNPNSSYNRNVKPDRN